MNVKNVMLFVICVIHANGNSIEHGENWLVNFICYYIPAFDRRDYAAEYENR